MSEVKRFKMEFLPEGLLRECVYAADFDRVTAERDALQQDINQRDEQIATLDLQREAHLRNSQVAERRIEVLERLLAKYYNRSDVCAFMAKDIGAALNPTGEVFIVNGRETTERPVCTVRECGKFAEAPWTNCREHWR